MQFLRSELNQRGIRSDFLKNVVFVKGLDKNANVFTKSAYNAKGAIAVTQGSTIYVHPGYFNRVANFSTHWDLAYTPFEEVMHAAQYSIEGNGFYEGYIVNSIGGALSTGDLYNGNTYEAFAKGAAHQMLSDYSNDTCQSHQ